MYLEYDYLLIFLFELLFKKKNLVLLERENYREKRDRSCLRVHSPDGSNSQCWGSPKSGASFFWVSHMDDQELKLASSAFPKNKQGAELEVKQNCQECWCHRWRLSMPCPWTSPELPFNDMTLFQFSCDLKINCSSWSLYFYYTGFTIVCSIFL